MGNGSRFGGLGMKRRQVLRGGAIGAGGLALANAFGALAGTGRKARAAGGFGPLAAKKALNDPTGPDYLALPEGFTYTVFGKAGTVMDDGVVTPRIHDGGACFWNEGEGKIYYVRNHEVGGAPNFAGAASGVPSYDAGSGAGGGTTTLVIDPDSGLLVRSYASLQGTRRNCAGGTTPWGSWLTCEEDLENKSTPPSTSRLQDHGYVFEVPAFGLGRPEPIVGLGRFFHEAAVAAGSGKVYETEDRDFSGFYKFKPAALGTKQPHELAPGDLARGGTLSMLKVKGVENLVTHRMSLANGPVEFDVDWVPIKNPNKRDGDASVTIDVPGSGPVTVSPGTLGVFMQGWAQGGTTFARGEGLWHFEERFYFCATTGGPSRFGQVWEYNEDLEKLRLVYCSTDAAVLHNPDNVCVSPRGGVVLCEDGGQRPQALVALNSAGEIFDVARNLFDNDEWAGASFSPVGDWLVASIQVPGGNGMTFAIKGPWENGGL
jgi:hypothetical protein